MRRIALLLLLVVSVAAIGQEDDLASDNMPPMPDNSASFYVLEGVTPGDVAQMTADQRAALQAKYRCDYPHALIDQQLAFEAKGHVGLEYWPNLRALERQDCPQQYPYRAGISPKDPASRR